eukprot:TRINITY_DN5211_c0_g1_i1.p1 TRINITY_DN5211_c0_g1~~TRINITY_DN5211_c0_g1_i1.p1  ORF type:complete len:307 (+),score=32.48 TRINITY_DN5211_c0_g1_i1:38-922(+)
MPLATTAETAWVVGAIKHALYKHPLARAYDDCVGEILAKEALPSVLAAHLAAADQVATHVPHEMMNVVQRVLRDAPGMYQSDTVEAVRQGIDNALRGRACAILFHRDPELAAPVTPQLTLVGAGTPPPLERSLIEREDERHHRFLDLLARQKQQKESLQFPQRHTEQSVPRFSSSNSTSAASELIDKVLPHLVRFPSRPESLIADYSPLRSSSNSPSPSAPLSSPVSTQALAQRIAQYVKAEESMTDAFPLPVPTPGELALDSSIGSQNPIIALREKKGKKRTNESVSVHSFLC